MANCAMVTGSGGGEAEMARRGFPAPKAEERRSRRKADGAMNPAIQGPDRHALSARRRTMP